MLSLESFYAVVESEWLKCSKILENTFVSGNKTGISRDNWNIFYPSCHRNTFILCVCVGNGWKISQKKKKEKKKMSVPQTTKSF